MSQIVEMVLSRIGAFVGVSGAKLFGCHQMLVGQFGEKMTMGIYLCAVVVALVIFLKIFKLAFDLLRFIVIPTVVAGYIASTFFSFNFLAALPIAGAAFSLLFLLKA